MSHNFLKITLPVHTLFIVSLYLMPQYLQLQDIFIWCTLWVLICGFGIAIGYHRLLSHKSFECSKGVRRLLAGLGALAGQGSPVFWVATHRGRHHPYADRDGDPHSPSRGRFHAFMGWQMYFSEKDFSLRHATDILRDPWLKTMSLHYYKLYWVFLILTAAFDWRLFMMAIVPSLVLAYHQENTVNLVSHLPGFGYRNFQTEDASNNHKLLALLTWGQALHNNHHKYPNRYDFSVREGEVDLAAVLIRFYFTKKKLVHQESRVG